MKNIVIRKYIPDYYSLWNEFVANAKNATFLFHRDFMEYHSNRFEDYSLLVFNEKEKLIAILPANRVGDTLFSHQGLTYGGLVITEKIILAETITIVKDILKFLDSNGIKTLNLKLIPSIYHKLPSNEMDYILFLLEAKLYRRDSIAIVDLEHKLPISRIRKRGIEKGNINNLRIEEVPVFDEFWNEILIPNLQHKYQVKPVHSIEEITYLKHKFPHLIKQFNVYFGAKIVAGITVFEKDNVVHPQYVSGNELLNNELGSLDFLYNHLMNEVYTDKKYFDFGISNESQGKKLNESLHYFKESFGARTINQDFYEVETKKYSLLEHVLI